MTLIIGIGAPKGGSEKSNSMNPTKSNVGDEQDTYAGKAEFNIPEGFEVPEGTEDGDTFEAMVTLKKTGNVLCVEAVDGIAVTAEDESEESSEDKAKESKEDSEMGFLDAIEAGASKK